MKKIISLFTGALLVCSLAAASVSGAGVLYMNDTFSSDELDETNWIIEGTTFVPEDGKLVGDATSVVQQSQYLQANEGNKLWQGHTAKVEITVREYDDERNNYSNGLWFKDYVNTWDQINDEGLPEDGDIYTLTFCYNTQTLTFDCSKEDSPLHQNNTPKSVTFPEGTILTGEDDGGPTTYTLGWRVITAAEGTPRVDCYMNDQLVMSVTTADGLPETFCGVEKSPLLLLNAGNVVEFDNVMVGSYDYNMFNESEDVGGDTPAPTPTPGDPQNPDNPAPVNPTPNPENPGNAGTNPGNADTSKNPASSNVGGGKTGDMAAVVAALAVVSLGAAVIIKRKEH